jgi:hypothetical protein
MPFTILEDPTGKPVTAKATVDGAALVEVEGLAAVDADTSTLASTVTSSPATASDPAVNVGITRSITITTQPAEGFAATAAPEANAAGAVVRVAGEVDLGAALEPAGESLGLSTVAYQGGAWGAVVEAAPDKPVHTRGADDEGNGERLATKAGQDAGLAAVDDLEADADAARVAVEELNEKTPAPLGAGLLAPIRASATSIATQLPNIATPRGFPLDNIDAANALYWGNDNTVTPSTGIKIEPGFGWSFALPNMNLVWLISATTTAYQIGAES